MTATAQPSTTPSRPSSPFALHPLLDEQTVPSRVVGARLDRQLAELVDDAARCYGDLAPEAVRRAAVQLLVVWQAQASGYGWVLADGADGGRSVVEAVVDGLVGVHASRQLLDDVGQLVGVDPVEDLTGHAAHDSLPPRPGAPLCPPGFHPLSECGAARLFRGGAEVELVDDVVEDPSVDDVCRCGHDECGAC